MEKREANRIAHLMGFGDVCTLSQKTRAPARFAALLPPPAANAESTGAEDCSERQFIVWAGVTRDARWAFGRVETSPRGLGQLDQRARAEALVYVAAERVAASAMPARLSAAVTVAYRYGLSFTKEAGLLSLVTPALTALAPPARLKRGNALASLRFAESAPLGWNALKRAALSTELDRWEAFLLLPRTETVLEALADYARAALDEPEKTVFSHWQVELSAKGGLPWPLEAEPTESAFLSVATLYAGQSEVLAIGFWPRETALDVGPVYYAQVRLSYTYLRARFGAREGELIPTLRTLFPGKRFEAAHRNLPAGTAAADTERARASRKTEAAFNRMAARLADSPLLFARELHEAAANLSLSQYQYVRAVMPLGHLKSFLTVADLRIAAALEAMSLARRPIGRTLAHNRLLAYALVERLV